MYVAITMERPIFSSSFFPPVYTVKTISNSEILVS